MSYLRRSFTYAHAHTNHSLLPTSSRLHALAAPPPYCPTALHQIERIQALQARVVAFVGSIIVSALIGVANFVSTYLYNYYFVDDA